MSGKLRRSLVAGDYDQPRMCKETGTSLATFPTDILTRPFLAQLSSEDLASLYVASSFFKHLIDENRRFCQKLVVEVLAVVFHRKCLSVCILTKTFKVTINAGEMPCKRFWLEHSNDHVEVYCTYSTQDISVPLERARHRHCYFEERSPCRRSRATASPLRGTHPRTSPQQSSLTSDGEDVDRRDGRPPPRPLHFGSILLVGNFDFSDSQEASATGQGGRCERESVKACLHVAKFYQFFFIKLEINRNGAGGERPHRVPQGAHITDGAFLDLF